MLRDPDTLRTAIREAVDGSAGRLTYKKLAATAKIDNSHLSNFVNGHRGLSPAAVEKVQHALAVLTRGAGDDRAKYLEFIRSRGLVDFRVLDTQTPSASLANVSVTDLFVEPMFGIISSGHRDKRYRFDEIECFAAKQGTAIIHILGPVGSGKTMFVLDHICQLATEAKQNPETILPVLFPLGALNDYLPGDKGMERSRTRLLDLIQQWYSDKEMSVGELFSTALESGRAYVFFDGLDEVETTNKYDQAVALIEDFSERYGNSRVIVTQRGSRPFGAFDILKHSLAVESLGFEPRQQRMLVERWQLLFAKTGERENSFDPCNRRFLDYLSTSALAQNPLLLTLMTILYFRDGWSSVAASVDRFSLFDNFFKMCLGDWSKRRSLAGARVPSGDLSIRLRIDLLSRLAWETMVEDRDRLLPVMAPAAVHDFLTRWYLDYAYPSAATTGEHEEARASNWADELQRYLRDTGILRGSLRYSRKLEFGFQEDLVRNWFLGAGLIEKQDFQYYYRKCIEDPAMIAWQSPVAFALAALEPRGRLKELNHAIEEALYALPFEERLEQAGLNGDAFFKVLPLGLLLCLEALQSGELTPRARKQIVARFREFYEATDYAVVTNWLHPLACRYIAYNTEAQKEWEPGQVIPVTPETLQRAIRTARNEDVDKWVNWIDRTWRYQTRTECFQLLLGAVQDRQLDLKLYEKIYRRIVFGLHLVDRSERASALDALSQIDKGAEQPEVVKSMIRFDKQSLFRGIGRLFEARGIDLSGQIKSWEIDDCFNQIKEWNLYDVMCNGVKLIKNILSRNDAREVAGKLRQIVEDSYRDPKDRAVAIVLLVADLRKSPQQIPYARWDDLVALLRVANEVGGDNQFLNVEACQLYDVAVWGVCGLYTPSEPTLEGYGQSGRPEELPDPIASGLPVPAGSLSQHNRGGAGSEAA